MIKRPFAGSDRHSQRLGFAIIACLFMAGRYAISLPIVFNLAQMDESQVIENLNPGDILFSYNIENTEWPILLINYFQKINQDKQIISKQSFSKYYHVFIYLGEGDFLEASELNKYSLRVFNLAEYRLKSSEEIHVFRFYNDNICHLAANIARKIAALREGKKDSNYSIWTSIRSVFTKGEFDDIAQKRYIKSAISSYLMDKYSLFPPSRRGEYHFICPALVAYAYQAAEAKIFLENLKADVKNKVLDQDHKDYLLRVLQDPDLDNLSTSKQRLAIDRWAKLVVSIFGPEISRFTSFALDAKVLSPQKFREHIRSNGAKFHFIMMIIAR